MFYPIEEQEASVKRYLNAIKSSFNHTRHNAKNLKIARRLIVLTLLIPLTFLLIECRSIDSNILLHKETVDRSIKPMKVIVNYDSIAETIGASPNLWSDNRGIKDIATVIKNHMSFDTEGGNYYLSIMIRKGESNSNPAYAIITGLTVFSISFLGWPLISDTVTIVLSAAIMNPDGRIIKTYEAKGKDTEYAAMYWGYGNPSYVATYKALTLACKDLREQLKQDSVNINKLIK